MVNEYGHFLVVLVYLLQTIKTRYLRVLVCVCVCVCAFMGVCVCACCLRVIRSRYTWVLMEIGEMENWRARTQTRSRRADPNLGAESEPNQTLPKPTGNWGTFATWPWGFEGPQIREETDSQLSRQTDSWKDRQRRHRWTTLILNIQTDI